MSSVRENLQLTNVAK